MYWKILAVLIYMMIYDGAGFSHGPGLSGAGSSRGPGPFGAEFSPGPGSRGAGFSSIPDNAWSVLGSNITCNI